VFKRFVQADIEDKEVYEGAGLGLSITKAYVEMLGGEIWLESKLSVGTKMYFTIPFENKKADTITINQNEVEPFNKKLKVLIVDDDQLASKYLNIIIKDFSSEIIFAINGLEAVEICKKNKDIDLVLMDIKMPVMSGDKATMEIRKFNDEIIIIAQTANALSEDKIKAFDAGCNEYITKPINRNKLKELIGMFFK
jgi:CheY-like chemotaxis protein